MFGMEITILDSIKKLLSCFHLTFGYLSATIITVGQFQGVLRTKQSVGEGFVDK